ncbi:MAG: terminase small subunit [Lachnospiraceae bacterium]|nr:terminase small subunit [Lachnospiraceae bacterium]
MTEKQKMFADEYLIDLNATRAYCIFREICASVPKERSAIPLGTERSSTGC